MQRYSFCQSHLFIHLLSCNLSYLRTSIYMCVHVCVCVVCVGESVRTLRYLINERCRKTHKGHSRTSLSSYSNLNVGKNMRKDIMVGIKKLAYDFCKWSFLSGKKYLIIFFLFFFLNSHQRPN